MAHSSCLRRHGHLLPQQHAAKEEAHPHLCFGLDMAAVFKCSKSCYEWGGWKVAISAFIPTLGQLPLNGQLLTVKSASTAPNITQACLSRPLCKQCDWDGYRCLLPVKPSLTDHEHPSLFPSEHVNLAVAAHINSDTSLQSIREHKNDNPHLPRRSGSV